MIFWIGWRNFCASLLLSPQGSTVGELKGAATGIEPQLPIVALPCVAKPQIGALGLLNNN